MIVLDAYALIALLAGEPAGEEVGRLISAGPVSVPASNLAEAADRLCRVHEIAIERTRSVMGSLEQSTELRVRAVERGHAWQAAEIRARHYHREHCPLSLADCLLLAVTGEGERLATSDLSVLATAEREGIATVALRNSRGRRP